MPAETHAAGVASTSPALTIENAIPPDMRAAVEARLVAIERNERVRILLAVESGSRAWGFPSPDSDYDVRFLYLRPLAHYLSVARRRDVIEIAADGSLPLDIGGWDFVKALGLALGSNPVLHEWLRSPIVYRHDGPIVDALLGFVREEYSLQRQALHYIATAERKWWATVAGREHVRPKDYCYVIRPLLATAWVVQNLSVAPMNVDELLAGIDLAAELRVAFADFRRRKQATAEGMVFQRETVLDRWIERELTERRADCLALPARKPDVEWADRLFREALGLE
jgi:hypothetical protein